MSGIANRAKGFVSQTGAVDDLKGGRETPTIFSAAFAMRWRAGCGTGAEPHSDAAGQDALDGASVELFETLNSSHPQTLVQIN